MASAVELVQIDLSPRMPRSKPEWLKARAPVDDNFGGARVFAETIRQIRQQVPGCSVEVLIPDFQGIDECLKIVLDAKPDILNHNTESVPRLYRAVRSGARYERTLQLLANVKE